mgnify:CR=1 FL=1
MKLLKGMIVISESEITLDGGAPNIFSKRKISYEFFKKDYGGFLYDWGFHIQTKKHGVWIDDLIILSNQPNFGAEFFHFLLRNISESSKTLDLSEENHRIFVVFYPNKIVHLINTKFHFNKSSLIHSVSSTLNNIDPVRATTMKYLFLDGNGSDTSKEEFMSKFTELSFVSKSNESIISKKNIIIASIVAFLAYGAYEEYNRKIKDQKGAVYSIIEKNYIDKYQSYMIYARKDRGNVPETGVSGEIVEFSIYKMQVNCREKYSINLLSYDEFNKNDKLIGGGNFSSGWKLYDSDSIWSSIHKKIC